MLTSLGAMAAKGGTAVNAEPQQRYNSPPPKPPRRRHSDQSSKLPGTAIRKKHFNSSSFPVSSKTSEKDSCVYGSESLPADWSLSHACQEKPMMVCNETENRHVSQGLTNYFCKTVVPEVGGSDEASSDSLKNFHEADGDSFSVLPSWNANCNNFCAPSSISHQNSIVPLAVQDVLPRSDCKSLLPCNMKNQWCLNKGMEFLLRRHHSDPVLSRFNQSCISSSASHCFSNAVLDCSFMFKGFHCPQALKDGCFASEEVKVLKERNDKLWKYVCSLQRKVDSLQNSSKDYESSSTFAELMCDVYRIQKVKDNIFEKRVEAALRERDTAAKELEDVLQSITKNAGDNDSSEDENELEQQEMKQLFQEIDATQNPVKLLQQQRILLSSLYHAKETKLNRVSHQLKLALEEKKHAVQKAEKLEDELMKWKSSRCLLHSEARQWEAGLLDALCQVITQRDSALAKVQCLQEQLQSFQIHHSVCLLQKSTELHNSDYESLQKTETGTSCSGGGSAGTVQEDLKEGKNQNHPEEVPEEIKFLKRRISLLTHQLDNEIKRRQAAEENYEKLDKLVSVLRKKINGLNTGLPV